MNEMVRAGGCTLRFVSFACTREGREDPNRRENESACDQVFDCEIFTRDPAATAGPLASWVDERAAHRCCGANGNIIAGVVADNAFRAWVQDALRPRIFRSVILPSL